MSAFHRRITPRGYIVFVVLMMLVVMSTVVAGQMTTASHEAIVGVHAKQEVQARAVADGCLALMTRYAQTYMDGCGTPPCKPDFDELLDVNNNQLEDAGDYLPAIGTRVTLPRTATSSPRRQWAFIARGTDGACLARFDDNSDDAIPTTGLPLGSTDPAGAESDAARLTTLYTDINHLDRDRAIVITVIGLSPVTDQSPAGAEFAYERANARVTLRRLFARENPFSLTRAGIVANVIDINNNANLCGVGGMSATTSIDVGTAGCFCGAIVSPTITGTTGAGGCACTPTTCNSTVVSIAAPPAFTVEVPAWSNSHLHLEGWGPPVDYDTPAPISGGALSTVFPTPPPALNGPHDPTVCTVYGDSNGRLYIWDAKDNDPVADLTAKGATVTAIGTHDCMVIPSGSEVPKPCSWDTVAKTVTCAAGQSPCWKLQMIGNEYVDDIAIGTVPFYDRGGSNETWAPNATVDIPNVSGSRRWAVAPTNAQHLCGTNTSGGTPSISYCTSCDGVDDGVVAWNANNHWHFEDGGSAQSINEKLPGPTIFVLRSAADRIHIKSTGPKFNITVLTDQKIEADNAVDLCGAKLNCGNIPGTPLFDEAEADAVARDASKKSLGFALKSVNLCEFDNAAVVRGDVRCGTVDIRNGLRMLGNISVYRTGVSGGGTAGPCNTSGTCDNAHLCLDNTSTIVGNVTARGDIRLNSNGRIAGRVFADGNICGNNGFTLAGAVMASGTLELNNNPTITVNPDFIPGGSPGFYSPGAVSFMEASW